jgi:hypothetical protein
MGSTNSPPTAQPPPYSLVLGWACTNGTGSGRNWATLASGLVAFQSLNF